MNEHMRMWYICMADSYWCLTVPLGMHESNIIHVFNICTYIQVNNSRNLALKPIVSCSTCSASSGSGSSKGMAVVAVEG